MSNVFDILLLAAEFRSIEVEALGLGRFNDREAMLGDVFGGLAVDGVRRELREDAESLIVDGNESRAGMRVGESTRDTRSSESGIPRSEKTEGDTHCGGGVGGGGVMAGRL